MQDQVAKESDEDKKAREEECGIARRERNLDSSTHGVNQIIAISQKALNEILKTRFDQDTTNKNDLRLQVFRHADEEGEIEADLSAPHIRLVAPPATSPETTPRSTIATVMFYLNFRSGFLRWRQGTARTEVKQDLAGWSVAFRVPLETTELSVLPEAIASKVKHLKEGDCSASQIFLSLTAATISGLDLIASTMPDLPSDPEMRKGVQAEFEKYMKRYLSYLKSGTFSVLGYTIRLEDKDHLPKSTVAPKATRVLVQNYKPRTETFAKRFPDNKGADMLLFLQQTTDKGNELRDYDPTKASNWILPDPFFTCGLTLQRHLYIDSYLCKMLGNLNMASLTLANDMFHQQYNAQLVVSNVPDWNIDQQPRPSQAPFRVRKDGKGAEFIWEGGWTAASVQYGTKFYANNASDSLKTVISNGFYWDEGENAIHITLLIQQARNLRLLGERPAVSIKDDWARVLGMTTVDVKWYLVLRLSTIEHGKLGVDLIQVKGPQINVDRDLKGIRIDFGTEVAVMAAVGDIAGYERAFARVLAESTQKQFANIFNTEQIRTDQLSILNSQSQYVFPGGGDFFMKNPVYNRHGDLVVDLNYEIPDMAIEYDFRLTVDTKTYSQIKSPWVKLESSNDGTQLILVPTKDQASLFTIDNGDLVVVKEQQKGRSKVEFLKFSLTLPGPVETQKKLIFVAEKVFNDIVGHKKSNLGVKLDFATTGSLFEFMVTKKGHGDHEWHPTFVLSDEAEPKIQLYTGKREDAKDKFFLLDAVY